MADNEKFPTLFEDETYLIFTNEEKDMVTFVAHDRGISLLFSQEEWRAFVVATLSAANKECEDIDEESNDEPEQTREG